MNFLRKLGIFVYLVLMIGIGALLISIAIETITLDMATHAFKLVSGSAALQIVLYAAGGLFILIGIVGPLKMARDINDGSIIAFQNPDGEVTVSLKAIEDYIRKISRDIPGINDVRAHVAVKRRAVNIECHVSLTAGSNIPDITERIQLAVRSRLQNMLGMEERINVKMHVSRIVKAARAEGMPSEEELGPAEIPFR